MTFRIVTRIVAGGIVAAVLASLPPVPRTPVIAGYLVFVGVVLLVELLAATTRADAGSRGSAFERALARSPSPPPRPNALTRLEDQVLLATTAALDVYVGLRPLLRDVAAQRLRMRHGVDLDVDPGRARALLGDEAWELVRPGVQPPADRFGPGISPARLTRALDAVEAL